MKILFLQLKCKFPVSRGGVLHPGGFSIWRGGSPFLGGVLHLGGCPSWRGGSPSRGGLHSRGVLHSRGGSPSGGVSIPEGGFSIPGGSPSGGSGLSIRGGFSIWGVYHVTYPIMHLMLPVCCLLTN